ncbi:MAG: MFS transporter [Acidimicrobiales bacterium]
MDRPPAVADEPAVITRQAWLALIVTTLVFFLVVVDVSAVNVAFPSIGDDFGVPEGQLSWIISGYNVTVGALLLVSGRLADSIGRKRMFLPGVAVFMVGSALCGAAPSAGWLIGARIVQAIGGAVVTPTALAVALPEFPPAKRSMAIGLAGATGSLGGVAGPALGSVIIDLWSWRGIFFINVPICLLVLAISPRLLRESKNPNATGRIDYLGVPIGTAAIGLIMMAIVQSETAGLTDPRVVAMFIVGMALIPVMIRRSARHPEPLLELELFRYPSFRSTNAGVAFYSLAFTSGFLVNSLFLQRFWDLPISTVGQALILSPLLAAIASPLSGRLADRLGHRWILAAGSVLCALGYVGYVLLLDEDVTVWTRYVPVSVLTGLGVGSTIATWSSAGLSDVPAARFGTANATVRTTQQVFYALGISIVVTILAAGGADHPLSSYRWAWLFVIAMYLASAVVIAITFPPGSSSDRAEAVAIVGRTRPNPAPLPGFETSPGH